MAENESVAVGTPAPLFPASASDPGRANQAPSEVELGRWGTKTQPTRIAERRSIID
jgi:hypothetical protein